MDERAPEVVLSNLILIFVFVFFFVVVQVSQDQLPDKCGGLLFGKRLLVCLFVVGADDVVATFILFALDDLWTDRAAEWGVLLIFWAADADELVLDVLKILICGEGLTGLVGLTFVTNRARFYAVLTKWFLGAHGLALSC